MTDRNKWLENRVKVLQEELTRKNDMLDRIDREKGDDQKERESFEEQIERLKKEVSLFHLLLITVI
jgi:predicted  nucleic acid-binding Zn-ribbon protein